MKRIVLAVSLMALPWLTACGGGSDAEKVVAQVGDRTITLAEMAATYQAMDPELRPPISTLEEKQKFLDDLINKELMEISAVEKYPELIIPQQNRLRRLREGELNSRVRKKLMADPIHISDEMKDRLYANASKERNLLAMLILDTDEADYVRRQLDEGGDFAQLARDHSAQWVDDTRAGELGWSTAGNLPYDLDLEVWAAPVGSLVGPHSTPMGTYILKVLDERKVDPPAAREAMDKDLHAAIYEPLYMNRQKAVLDSLHASADPYYSDEARALLMVKYYWEPPQDQADNEYAYLDSPRITPTFTAEERGMVVVDFKDQPDWTAGEFSERLAWYAGGLWPRGHSEQQLIDCLDLLVRDHLIMNAAEYLGITQDPEFLAKMENKKNEMRVNYFYYNNVVREFEPDEEGILAYFREHREHYTAPSAYKAASFISANKALIEQLATEWKAGAKFVDLRTKYEAQDPNLVAIGESGWIYEGQDVVRDETMSGLKEGGISNLVTRADQTAVFRMIARRGPRPYAYEEIKETVDDHAKTVLVDRGLSDLLKSQRLRIKVVVNEKVLKDFSVDVSGDSAE